MSDNSIDRAIRDMVRSAVRDELTARADTAGKDNVALQIMAELTKINGRLDSMDTKIGTMSAQLTGINDRLGHVEDHLSRGGYKPLGS